MSVRVRFAPSPTGPLHIGGVRTALFNYLWAKKQGGTFILRLEDTDQTRLVKGAADYIVKSLQWLNIPADEGFGFGDGAFGPYQQSERLAIYKKYVQQLLNEGKAYYAFDTPEELQALREQAEAKKTAFQYGIGNREELNNSLNLSQEEVQKKLQSNEAYVVRFKIPEDTKVHTEDSIRGFSVIDSFIIDDKVLMKSDGFPTYHLANIVDDHLMQITHVIRGEEWLPSLAFHVLLYEAFGWEKPQFAHLPLILKPDGKGKLSKRDGEKGGFPVFPLNWKGKDGEIIGFKEQGYLAETMANALALLGWSSTDDQEMFTLDELIAAFQLERVQKGGAKFDIAKFNHLNHLHLQNNDNEAIAKEFGAILVEKGIASTLDFDVEVVNKLKERIYFVKDLWDEAHYLYLPPESFEEKALKKAWKEGTEDILIAFQGKLELLSSWDESSLHTALQDFVQEQAIGFGKIGMPLRLCLVGDLKGTDLPWIMEKIGKEETMNRLNFMRQQMQ